MSYFYGELMDMSITLTDLAIHGSLPPMPQRISDEKKQEAIRAYQAGRTCAEVEKQFGIHKSSLYGALRRAGIKPHRLNGGTVAKRVAIAKKALRAINGKPEPQRRGPVWLVRYTDGIEAFTSVAAAAKRVGELCSSGYAPKLYKAYERSFGVEVKLTRMARDEA